MPLLGKTKQDLVSEFRSEEILEAARKIFARKGFASATMDEIADAAELAKGTLYLYFPSKRDLFVATLRRGIEALHEETNARVAGARSAGEKIRAFIALRVEYFETNRDFFKIYFSEFSNLLIHPLHLNSEFRDLYIKQANLLERIVEEGVAAGEIRAVKPRAAALTIYDMTRGLIAQRMLGWTDGDTAAAIDHLFGIVWKGIVCG